MKYWFDTEFIERPNTIDLISIGIIDERGRTFYAEHTSFDERKADNWVHENVISKLRFYNQQSPFKGFNNASIKNAGTANEVREVFGTTPLIKQAVLDFIGNDKPEFWAYYADYDWVVFCWIFGKMIDLPEGWPMYCRDIKQWCNHLGNPTLPKQAAGDHNALEDALWNKEAWKFLNEFKSPTYKG